MFFKLFYLTTIYNTFNQSDTLRELLVFPKDKTNKGDQLDVVYEINCHNCNTSYIAETKRNLSVRAAEHHGEGSPVADHTKTTRHNSDTKEILDKGSSWFGRDEVYAKLPTSK